MDKSQIHSQMKKELQDKEVFSLVHSYCMQYLDKVGDREVFPSQEALDALAQFDEDLQENTADAETVINQLHKYGSPATVAQMGGRYFGFVNGAALPVGLAAKQLATYWDQNAALRVISPITSKLEMVVEKWLVELFDLPKKTRAGFVSGSSTASFCGLAAARFSLLNRLGWNVNSKGLGGAPRLRIVTGKHAHSSVLKVISLLGFGTDCIEWVEVDEQGRIKADQIPQLDNRTILILQAGNVTSGAFDDFKRICSRANESGAWVHVDGAFGLWVQASKLLNHLTDSVNLADSWTLDGHKTLNTPYDCGIVLCKDEQALVSALHSSGSYIVLSEEKDGMFYTPEMSRRARAVELWATMKYLGKNGIDELVTTLHHRARLFASEIAQISGFEVLNEIWFNQVIVRCASDELTESVLKEVQVQRTCWAGGSMWFGKRVIRISICSWRTSTSDILLSVGAFKDALARLS